MHNKNKNSSKKEYRQTDLNNTNLNTPSSKASLREDNNVVTGCFASTNETPPKEIAIQNSEVKKTFQI